MVSQSDHIDADMFIVEPHYTGITAKHNDPYLPSLHKPRATPVHRSNPRSIDGA